MCCQFMLLVLSRKKYVLTLQKTRRLPLIAELLMLCCKNCIKHISVYLNTIKHWTKKPLILGDDQCALWGGNSRTVSVEMFTLASADMHFAAFEVEVGELVSSLPSVYLSL